MPRIALSMVIFPIVCAHHLTLSLVCRGESVV
jgi:hypothetical protein